MINKDRIVPITKTDLLTVYGTIINLTAEGGATPLAAENPCGDFNISDLTSTLLLSEPARKINITAESGSFYFVPAFDFDGIAVDGAVITMSGDEISTDGISLYLCTLSEGTVTITACTPSAQ